MSPFSAAHKRLIRRRLLSSLATPDSMKKKKPKKSSGPKSSPKIAPSGKASPTRSEVPDPPSSSSMAASDAPFSSLVDSVAQQSLGLVDLTLPPLDSVTMESPSVDAPSTKTVIATTVADPSSHGTIHLELETISQPDSAPTDKTSPLEVMISANAALNSS